MLAGGIRQKFLKKLPRYSLVIATIIIVMFLCFVSGATADTPIMRLPTNLTLNLTLYQALTMDLTVNTTSANVGAPVWVDAVAKYPNGTYVGPGYKVTLTSSPSGGSFDVSSGTTGYYKTLLVSGIHTNFKAVSANTYTINAIVTDPSGTYRDGSASKTVQINAVPIISTQPNIVTPTTSGPSANASAGGFDVSGIMPILPYLIIGIIIILLILAILAYLWFKKNLRIEARKTSAPCDGKSTIPIRVSFVNAFGRPRKWKTDVEVQMETTAGSIQNVVLPNGRDFVDTDLTTSKEFGNVTVTGRYNGKVATVPVSFTYKQAVFDVTVTPDSIMADGNSSANISIKLKDESGNSIAPLEDKTIQLKTTLGEIPATVKLSARTSEANISLTSGNASGTAVITAIEGTVKGEAKLTLKGVPKRFCMHCGSAMSMEASSCPKCGLTPPSGVDTKQCSTCGVILPEAAKFCHKCGARQPEMKPVTPPTAKQPEPPK
jgi:ribosomal protein L40E